VAFEGALEQPVGLDTLGCHGGRSFRHVTCMARSSAVE
jgi:hypothetical protein